MAAIWRHLLCTSPLIRLPPGGSRALASTVTNEERRRLLYALPVRSSFWLVPDDRCSSKRVRSQLLSELIRHPSRSLHVVGDILDPTSRWDDCSPVQSPGTKWDPRHYCLGALLCGSLLAVLLTTPGMPEACFGSFRGSRLSQSHDQEIATANSCTIARAARYRLNVSVLRLLGSRNLRRTALIRRSLSSLVTTAR
jgi:hypothetical protein